MHLNTKFGSEPHYSILYQLTAWREMLKMLENQTFRENFTSRMKPLLAIDYFLASNLNLYQFLSKIFVYIYVIVTIYASNDFNY
jgi:hypothetical protein